MSRPTIRWAWITLVLDLALVGAEAPTGTVMEVRLKTKLASATAKKGDTFEAVALGAPLAGAVVQGTVESAEAATADKRASLELKFTGIVTNKGTVPLKAQLDRVDNARESVTGGKIIGILGSETLSGKMDSGLGKLGAKAGAFADILKLAKAAVFKEADTEINYDVGTEFYLKLESPLKIDLPAPGQGPDTLKPVPDMTALAALANSQPFQTVADNPPKPSDVTNLMLIGTTRQIEEAFAAAGWNSAAGLTGRSKIETLRAVVENRGYKEAPMSILKLEDSVADMNWQKMLNTFAKRHHLRIFRRPAQWEGKQVWVCSSTHDTGIEFSPQNRTFIHKIDEQIDREREKVVSDLVFTGLVESTALVERPAVPKQSANATGDKLITDGRMAVVIFR